MPWQAKFAALAVIWGSSFLLMKVGLEAMAPLQVATLRVLAGTATLLAVALPLRVRLPRERSVWGHLCATGFLLCTLPFTLFPLAEQRISSALAGIGNATTPMATVVFTALLIPKERPSARTVWAVVVGFLGVVVILQPWQAAGRPDPLGFAMALVAGASYGLGWTYVRRFIDNAKVPGLALPTAQLLAASVQLVVVLVVWWALGRGDAAALAAPWSPHQDDVLMPLLAVLVLGAVGTGLAFVLQFDVVREVGPTVGATVTYLIPVVAVVLGVVFLHERLAWPQLAGAGIILAAAVVIGRTGASRRTTTAGASPRAG